MATRRHLKLPNMLSLMQGLLNVLCQMYHKMEFLKLPKINFSNNMN